MRLETLAALLALFPVAACASWQLVETWHHGSIFAERRARLEASSGFISDLLLCPFCLSHWTAAFCAVLTFLALEVTGFGLLLLPLYAFAVTRVSNVCNDLSANWSRTPGRHGADADLDDAINKLRDMEHDAGIKQTPL